MRSSEAPPGSGGLPRRADPRPAALIDPGQARARAVAAVGLLPVERFPLIEAAGLALAEPLIAPFDLPRFANAAMDGFAVRSRDTGRASARLRVVDQAYAGRPAGTAVGPGQAVAITTGAVMPPGADAIVRAEDVEEDGDLVLVRAPVSAGEHVRLPGEDVAAGSTVLEAGAVIGPGQVSAAAALGFDSVAVHRRARVAVVPTGDEVRPPGGPIGPGEVYDAVSPALVLLLEEAGAVARSCGVAPDEPGGLLEALRGASRGMDALITVGGVSMGQRDLVRRIGRAGDVAALSVALRPAKPFAVGHVFGVPLFGLPGNPASALAAFEELVRPAILAMMGRPPLVRPAVRAELAEPVRQRPGRLHLLRAEVWREGGRLLARPAGLQGAGMIHSLARASGWAVIPSEVEELPAGAEVEVRLLVEPR